MVRMLFSVLIFVPYLVRNSIHYHPKDLYSLFGSRLLHISTQIVSTRLSYSIQCS